MQQDEINELLQKKQAGKCTPEENAFLESWYAQWNKDLPLGLTEGELLEDLIIIKKMTGNLPAESKSGKLKQSLLIAASLLLILSTGLFFYVRTQKPAYNLAFQDIKPGGNKATITLANGQKLDLKNIKGGVVIDKSSLGYNDGTTISEIISTKDAVQELMLSTPRGGQYHITLSDGTKVWLNAASSIKFPSSFAGLKERRVELTGEAYFKVVHDAKQPFRVLSAGQIAEDLGTSFNINSYADEPLSKTTLVEGSMQIQSLKNPAYKNPILLAPNQQASINAAGAVSLNLVNPDEALDWKNGYFIFESEDIESVMRRISRWYDVEVVFEGKVPNDKFGGTVSRFSNVSKVLSKLELTNKVHFRIEERRIIVTR